MTSAAQAGAAALRSADFPPLQMAARAGYLKAPEEPEWNGGSAEDSDISGSVVSSTASITKVSTPTAHSATNPLQTHRTATKRPKSRYMWRWW